MLTLTLSPREGNPAHGYPASNHVFTVLRMVIQHIILVTSRVYNPPLSYSTCYKHVIPGLAGLHCLDLNNI